MSLAMQTPNSECSSLSTPSSWLCQTYNTSASTLSSPSPSLRHWRPASQRNLKNQWLKLVSHKQQWFSASSNGRNHATDLVNKYLSRSTGFGCSKRYAKHSRKRWPEISQTAGALPKQSFIILQGHGRCSLSDDQHL